MKNIRYVFLILSVLLTGLFAQGHSSVVFDLIGTDQVNGYHTSKTSSINIQITIDESGGNVSSIQLRGVALTSDPSAYDDVNFPDVSTILDISYSAQYSNSGGSGPAYSGIFNTGEVHTITVTDNEIEDLQTFSSGKRLYFVLVYNSTAFDGDYYSGDDIRGNNSNYYYFDIDTQGPTLSAIKENISNDSYYSGMYISTPQFIYSVGSESIVSGVMTWTRTAGSGSAVLTDTVFFAANGSANTTKTYNEDPGLTSGDVYTIELSVSDNHSNSNRYSYTNVTYDTDNPTVENVYSVDGNYIEDDEIIIYIQFSEDVLRSGTPTLSLEVPALSGYTVDHNNIGYGTNTLQFSYVVQDGHASDDLQYENTASLTAGDYIRDRAGNDAVLALPGLATANSLAGNNDISIDALDPGTFTVQSVIATGGTGVADYWNGTNTGVNVTVPIADDNSLDGGTVQLQARTADVETFQDLGPLTTIAAVNTTKIFSASASGTGDTDIDDLINYNDGDLLEFQAIITDNAGNSRTGTPSVTKLTVDTQSPTVTNVTSNDIEMTYAIGDAIDIIVNFNSAVDVVTTGGTPQLTLETGDITDAVVNYSSGTGTSVLVFIYIVGTDEESDDLNYASTGALVNNGGTLRDAAGNDAVLTLPATGSGSSLGGGKNYVVDGVPPANFPVGTASVNGTVERSGYWNGTSTSIDIIIPIANDNSLKTGTAQLKGKISSNPGYSSFGSPVTITAGHLTAGSLTISTTADDFENDILDFDDGETVTITAVLTDSTGNSKTGTASGTTIIVDQDLPANFTVGSVLTTGTPIVANYWNSHNTGVTVTIFIANDATLNGGTIFIKANAGSGFETVGDTIAVNAINTNKSVTLSRTQIEDINGYTEGGNISFRALLTDVAGNSRESSISGTTLAIDETAPTVSGVTSDDEDSNPFKIDDVIDLDVVFNEPVNVVTTGGPPQLTVNTNAVVNYTSGDDTTTLTFQYEVGEGEESDDLDYTSTAALTLNGATIRDGAGNNAVLTLPTVGLAGSLGFNKAIVIDGVLPSDFTVGSVLTNGGVIVAGYWNASNTAIRIRVPLEISDSSLDDGRIQLEAEADGSFEDLGALTTINGDSVAVGFQTITVQATEAIVTGFEDLFGFDINDEITIRAVITDEAGNSKTGTASGTTIIVDQTAPTALIVGDVTTSGGRLVDNYWNGTNEVADIIIPLETSDLSLTNGAIRIVARAGNNTWTFIGDTFSITDLDRLNGSKTVSVDSGGTASTDIHELPGFANYLNLQFRSTVADVAGNTTDWTVSDSILLVDEQAPTVSSVSSTLGDGYYTVDQLIPITILFDETLQVSTIAGTPYIEIQTGTSYPVFYTGGDNTDLLSFNYTVLTGHNNDTLDYVANNSLILNGGSIIDVAGNNANLTLDDPQGIGSLAASRNISVDTQAPEAFISISPDSLVKAADSPQIIADFSEQMDSAGVYILYNGGAFLDTVSMNNQDVLTWVYTIPAIPDSNDGRATISITGLDRAGNALTDLNTSGRDILRLDNVDPSLSNFTISSGDYINHRQLGWSLTEFSGRLESGTIFWDQVDGSINDVTTNLSGDELLSGLKSESDLNDPPALVDGTTYDIIFTAIDSAGNAGNDTILTVTYDVTPPSVNLTYSHYHVAVDTVVTISAEFSEKIPIDPPISIAYNNGAGSTVSGTMTPVGNDSLNFSYLLTAPSGASDEGVALISFIIEDLASNQLPADSTFNSDTLIVDNTTVICTFMYTNQDQPTLDLLGRVDDVIEITANFNDQMRKDAEAPTLNIQYADSTDDSIVGQLYSSKTNGDSTWIYEIILPDSSKNSGIMTVSAIGLDLAGNSVTTALLDAVFEVDNTPPTAFATGAVTTMVGNNVTGWINGSNDSLKIKAPILIGDLNGILRLAFAVPAKMDTASIWAIAGAPIDLIRAADPDSFYVNIDTIITALNNAMSGDLEQGDEILTGVIKFDEVGNDTRGQVSSQKLLYDVLPPAAGSPIVWNSTSPDTLISNDSLQLIWGSYNDPVAAAAGIERYEWAVETGGPGWTELISWTTAATDTSVNIGMALTHSSIYRIKLRAFDVAGNQST
ncbi:MAG: hypothetical protein HQ528_02235, partial [Candidatus Marinimicrobia bacterium]|nr:hypothetical protein [Candidatus Neomarinimicrobiota bacterium]